MTTPDTTSLILAEIDSLESKLNSLRQLVLKDQPQPEPPKKRTRKIGNLLITINTDGSTSRTNIKR